ncbi:MAG: glycosyltransferase [Muribaculaceae bacterium]|nr:glycosyltransferase [Muribaculaceae bacterium]
MEVSIILLTYNQETSIKKALDSILMQKFNGPYEIIIGDDCSTDSTGEICKEYAARYPDIIKYYRRDENLGLVKNYYDCLDKATGKYIADCAGDDFWVNEHRLQILYDFMESHPDTNLVAGEWLCLNPDQDIIKAGNAAPPGEYSGRKDLLNILLNKTVINLSSSLYKSAVVKQMIQRFPKLFIGDNLRFEDLQIILTCISQGHISVIPTTVYMYCTGHDSVSNPKTFLKKYLYTSNAIIQHRNLVKFFLPNPSPSESEQLKRYYKNKANYILSMAFKAGPDVMITYPLDRNIKKEASAKGVFYYCLMQNKILWESALKVIEVLKPDKLQIK